MRVPPCLADKNTEITEQYTNGPEQNGAIPEGHKILRLLCMAVQKGTLGYNHMPHVRMQGMSDVREQLDKVQ